MKLTTLRNIIKEEITKLQEQSSYINPNIPLPAGTGAEQLQNWSTSWMQMIDNMPQANRCNFINGRISGWENKMNTAGPRFQNQLNIKQNVAIAKGIQNGCFTQSDYPGFPYSISLGM